LDHITEGTFTEQTEITNQNIVSAHSWDMALMSGLKTAGALGNTQEKRAAYEIINNTVIPNYTNPQLRFFNAMLAKKGIDATVTVQELEPLSMKSSIDINKIMTKGEARELLGMEEMMDEDFNNSTIEGTQTDG